MIVDIHTHLWTPEYLPVEWLEDYHRKGLFDYDRIDVKRLIADLDEGGVDKAVVLAYELEHMWNPAKRMNRFVVEKVKEYPERLIGFAGVAPLDKYGRLNRRSLEDFEKYITEYGMKGMKMLPVGDHYKPNDNRVYVFYEKAAELKVPILLHQAATLAPPNTPMEYGRPTFLEEPLLDFPELKFLAAHFGYPWAEELLVMMRKIPNLYTDVSASVLYRPSILSRNLAMAKEYGVLDRALFGTDYPVTKQRPYVDWIKNSYNQIAEKNSFPVLTQEDISGILGGNAVRFLGLN